MLKVATGGTGEKAPPPPQAGTSGTGDEFFDRFEAEMAEKYESGRFQKLGGTLVRESIKGNQFLPTKDGKNQLARLSSFATGSYSLN